MQPFDENSTKREGRLRPFPLGAGKLPSNVYSVTKIARYADCDLAGVVYAPRFIEVVHGVIEDFFNSELRINYHEIVGVRHMGFSFASVDTDFFAPARLGDLIVYTPLVSHIGRTSIVFVVHCHRGAEEVMRCRLVMVTISLSTLAAISIPGDIREALTYYQANSR